MCRDSTNRLLKQRSLAELQDIKVTITFAYINNAIAEKKLGGSVLFKIATKKEMPWDKLRDL